MSISKIINDGIGDVSKLTVNRSGDGVGLSIERDGTERFTISVSSTDNIKIGATTGGGAGLEFFGAGGTAPTILPVKEGTTIDNEVDLGRAAQRFQDLYLGGRLFIGGTGSANALDDYEEGSWSPSLSVGTASAGYARYTKIGNTVHIWFYLHSFSNRTSTSPVSVSGLPFAIASTSRLVGPCMHRFINSGGDQVSVYGQSGNSNFTFYSSNQNTNYTNVDHQHLSSSSSLFFAHATYETS